MSDILELDLTGRLPANRVSEIIEVGAQGRVFPLSRGSFYTKSVRVTNSVTHVTLRKDIDYKLVEQDINAQRMAEGHDICTYIYVIAQIPRVTVDYQAVGGIFQFNGTMLYKMIMDFINSRGTEQIVGLPTQYPPTQHIQNINDFNKLGNLDTAIKRIEAAIRNGKSEAMVMAMMNYAEDLGNDLGAWLQTKIVELEDHLQQLTTRNTYRDGRYYLNSSSTNPAATKGGAWTLDSNVMLYGAMSKADVGTYEEVESGAGHIATLKHLWRRNDFGDTVTYDLTANTSAVNEGESITFNLSTVGLQTGASVPYYIRGVQAADIVGGELSGSFIVDDQGRATLIIDIVKDFRSEGTEVLTLILTNAPTNSVSITINDTSIDPVYNLFFSSDVDGLNKIVAVEEAAEFFIQIRGVQIPEGNRMYLLTAGSTTVDSDFESPVPPYVDIFASSATIPMRTTADYTSEGNESLVLSLCTEPTMATRVVSTTLTVLDTSLTSTYTGKFVLNANGTGTELTQVNEGNVIYYVITGVNSIDGTTLLLDYSGTTNAADFMADRPTSTVINNGRAIIPYSIRNDLVTEGNETLIISVREGTRVVTANTLTILDTSINQEFDMWFSSNTAGTDRIASVPEGSQCYLQLRTVGVANGTIYPLVYSGTATAEDFDNSRPSTITVNNNTAYLTYQIRNDRSTEGSETFVVTVDNAHQPTASIQILDTSASPAIALRWSSNAAGTDTISSTPEGRAVYLVIQTQNIFNGDMVAISYGGTVTDEDFETPRPTTAIVNDGRAVIEYTVKADNRLEGTENMLATVSFLTASTESSRLDILDTSTPPKLTLTASVLNVTTSKMHGGDVVTFRVTDINKQTAPNAVVYIHWQNPNIGNPAIPMTPVTVFSQLPPTTVVLSNWSATFTVSLKFNGPVEQTRFPIVAALSRAEADTAIVDTPTAAVNLMTVEPVPFTGYFSGNPDGRPIKHMGIGRRIWYVLKSPNVPDGARYRVQYKFNDRISTENIRITEPLDEFAVFDKGVAYVSMTFTREFMNDEVVDEAWANGEARFKMELMLLSEDSSIQYTSSKATQVIAQSTYCNSRVGQTTSTARIGPREFRTIDVYGPSGAGGNAVWSNEYTTLPTPGTAGIMNYTLPNNNSLVVTLQPGVGGTPGAWSNGSAYHVGAPGLGGLVEVRRTAGVLDWSLMKVLHGTDGQRWDRWDTQWGAAGPAGEAFGKTTTRDLFKAGNGAWGVPSWNPFAYGGAGGAGGYARIVIYNPTSETLTYTFTGGNLGKISEHGSQKGTDGRYGQMIVTWIEGVTGVATDLPPGV